MRITKSTVATPSNNRFLAVVRQIGYSLTISFDDCTERHFDNKRLATLATAISLTTGLTIFCSQLWLVAKIQQSIQVFGGSENHISATSAVTTVWAAFIDIFLMSKTNSTITAFASFYVNLRIIYKHIRLIIT